MNIEKLLPKLPLFIQWIDETLAAHAGKARPMADFGFTRLPGFYSRETLARAKVVVLDRIPTPPMSAMGIPEFAEFEQGDFDGMSFKDTLFIKTSEAPRESLHFHELVHVVQWQHLGAENFLLAYAIGLLGFGYRNSPLEVMAYDLQAHFDQNGPPKDVEAEIRKKLDEFGA